MTDDRARTVARALVDLAAALGDSQILRVTPEGSTKSNEVRAFVVTPDLADAVRDLPMALIEADAILRG